MIPTSEEFFVLGEWCPRSRHNGWDGHPNMWWDIPAPGTTEYEQVQREKEEYGIDPFEFCYKGGLYVVLHDARRPGDSQIELPPGRWMSFPDDDRPRTW